MRIKRQLHEAYILYKLRHAKNKKLIDGISVNLEASFVIDWDVERIVWQLYSSSSYYLGDADTISSSFK